MRETVYWTWFIIAGIALICLLGLHMIIMHLDGLLGIFNPAGTNSVDWKNVIFRSKTIFFTVTYIIMLGAALYHGFYGLRTILIELGFGDKINRLVTMALWLLGIFLFIIGTCSNIAVKIMEKIV